MRTLIIDLCYEENSLHFKEFVQPVIDIVQKDFEVIYFKKLNEINLNDFNKIILCGVALKDFEYNNHLKLFEVLKEFKGDVLGICAGAQIIGQLFGAKLKQGQEIGLIDLQVLKEDKIFDGVDLSEVYCLHNSCLENLDAFEILAKSKNFAQVFKKERFYGVVFHPEVRNKKLIYNFINF